MIRWFRKPSITFDCLIPGVERIMPMITAKEYKHAWVSRAQQDLAKERKSSEWGMKRLIHTAKCPGIFQLQRNGWIMRSWQDFTIETNGDGTSFVWTSAIDQTRFKLDGYIGSHPAFQLADYMENWRPNTLRTLIKINSPWRCNVPKGYVLLETNVPYQDENRFTTVQGMFSHEQGYAQLNPQFLWHVPRGKVLVKAGTPLAQYMLIRKEHFDMCINPVGTTSDQEFFDLVNNYRFVKNYGETKKIFTEGA